MPNEFDSLNRNVGQNEFDTRIDPRRMMWAGTIADIGGFIANPFDYQFKGLGQQYMMQAEQFNRQGQQLQNRQQTQTLQNQNAMLQGQNLGRAGELQQRTLDQKPNEFGQFPAQEQEYQQWLQSSQMPDSTEARTEFAKYQRSTGIGGNASQRPTRTWVGEDGNMMYLSATGEVVNTGEKGTPPGEKIVEIGGAQYVERTMAGGQTETVPLDQYQKDYRAGARRDDKLNADLNASDSAFHEVLRTDVPMLEQQLKNIDNLTAAIEGGQFTATGPGEGIYKKYTNKETAQLEVENLYQSLLNLQIANLAPVTENEMALVRSMYADIDRDPEANLGRLKGARKIVTDKMNIIKAKYDYAQKNNMSLGGYQDTIPWLGGEGGSRYERIE